jgi:hypothetical protein
MSKAVVTKPFPGRADDEFKVRQFQEGEEISGELAAVAVKNGWAKPVGAAPKASKGSEKGEEKGKAAEQPANAQGDASKA